MLAVQNAPARQNSKLKGVGCSVGRGWGRRGAVRPGSHESCHGVLGTGCTRVTQSNLSDTSLTASLERGLNSDEVPGREGYPG